MPPKGQITAPHGHDSRYRAGCRCAECRAAHAEESKTRRQEKTYGKGGPMGPEMRRRILTSLAKTGNVVATASKLGITWQSIHRAAKALPEFGERVDELTAAQD